MTEPAAHPRSRTRPRSRRTVPAAAVAALTATAVLGAAAPASAGPATVDRAVVQRAADAMAASGAQGVQIRITERGRSTLVRSGTADATGHRPVPPDGRFRIGSITKVFVATVVLQLAGEGRLDLDAPVSRFLPGLLPEGDRITVRMLLQHTSGVPNYTDHLPLGASTFPGPAAYDVERHRSHDPRELVALANRHPRDFPPGQGWNYSNTGYVVLGLLVEQVTGKPWGRAVEERVIGPLRLEGTSVPGERAVLPPPHAHAYSRIGGQVVNVTRLNPSVASAAGEMVSTTADLDRFLVALLGGRLLAPAQLTEMQRTLPASEGYGLRLMAVPTSCGVTAWGHGGGIEGYLSLALSTADTRRRLELSVTTAPDPGELRGYAEVVEEAFCP